jgi:hypothetical protein
LFELNPPKHIQHETARARNPAAPPFQDPVDVAVGSPLQRIEHPRGMMVAYFAMALVGFSIISLGIDGYVQTEFLLLANEENELMNVRRHMNVRRNDQRLVDLDRRWQKWDQFARIARTAYFLTNIVACIGFLIWISQAHGNLPGLRASGLSYSRRWAVTCWFVPIANCFAPFAVLQEIWRASHPNAIDDPLAWRNTPYAKCTRWWWFLVMAAAYFAVMTWFFGPAIDPLLDHMEARAYAWIACDICVIAAGVIIIYVIYQTMRRQFSRFENLQEL